MVLVDTSVWVSHFRETNDDLAELLNKGEVVCHPFIIGELACGDLKNRVSIIALLEALPMALVVDHEEVLSFVEARKIMGKGLGYVDVHLLAAALLTGVSLWTLDKKLDKVAGELQCRYRQRTR
ncbi:type II toxin-antitoxin system VapC family toxin [Syntrophorhabdus aromaticivorans]|uniref:Type II toxin-antitoxin system VapC family toxin n=1 Tax=Syntrophorhabdus aromaticivorans TaxID=328301 RepID=A0A971M6S0_9BACT|nr:type II toxin-antitoxin system VapC family toxin [Syntrophorhabdus aromaticivorans]NLW36384.1 type II toxin-antitoxin system VapC family toxin [Syntrophorhabdus aromaticivorans]